MKVSNQSKLEGLHYEILQAYLETGDTSVIEDKDMVLYLEQLELVRGWHYSLQSERKILNALVASYPNLTIRTAKTRYTDAINYYYGDVQIKKIAYRNKAADAIERLATAIIKSAKEPKDYKYAGDLIHKAEIVRGSMEPDTPTLPDHIYQQRQPIYVLDPTMLGLPKADRNQIAKQIENFEITEAQKQKLIQESGVAVFDLEQRLDE